MKARKLFRASLRALILLAFGVLMTGASAFAFSVTHEFPLPGGGKITVTSTGKAGVTDHLTWTMTDSNGKKMSEGKAKNDGKGGVKSEWSQYDGMGTKTATCSGTSSPAGSKNVTKDLLTGTKTTQYTNLGNNGQKTESGTTTEPKNAGVTTSVTTYKDGKPSVTTTTNSNPYSKEEQHWDEHGKQVGGTLEDNNGKYDYDSVNGTYKNPSKTQPVNPAPPAYSRLAVTETPNNGLVPTSLDNESFALTSAQATSGLGIALKYINRSLASGMDAQPQGATTHNATGISSHLFGGQRTWAEASGEGSQPPKNTGLTSLIFGSQRSWGEASGDHFTLPSSAGNPPRTVTEHQLSYRYDGQVHDVAVHNGKASWQTPEGGWSPIREGDPNLYAENPGGGWSQVYPGRPREMTGSNFFNTGSMSHEVKFGAGYLGAEQADEFFPTGFDFGVSVDFIFGADPNFLLETHHHIVHGHTWKTEKEFAGQKLEDADGIQGGPDILVNLFKNKHVKVDTSKTVTTHTKKDISVVEDGDVGGNLNVHYWCNRYVGIEAFNTILSGPGGTVDILGARVEARLPMICGGESHPFGFAPFVYAGCSGTMGGYDDLFGLDIGGGIMVRTRCGFNCSLEAGANLNGTQNYGMGSFNVLWHKPLQ